MLALYVREARRFMVASAKQASVVNTPMMSQATALMSTAEGAAGGSGAGDSKKKGAKKKDFATVAEYLKDYEDRMKTEDLRPLIPENAEELLAEAEAARPERAGYRGSRRKKQQRIRFETIRAQDAVWKQQKMKAYAEKLKRRSPEAIKARLARVFGPYPFMWKGVVVEGAPKK